MVKKRAAQWNRAGDRPVIQQEGFGRDQQRTAEMPNDKCNQAESVRIKLEAHERLDDTRLGTLMDYLKSVEKKLTDAHVEMHRSVVDLGREMRDSIKASNDIHLKIMTRILTGLIAMVIGLVLYIWFHRNQIIGG